MALTVESGPRSFAASDRIAREEHMSPTSEADTPMVARLQIDAPVAADRLDGTPPKPLTRLALTPVPVSAASAPGFETYSSLQRHVAFFDPSGTQHVTMAGIYEGGRRLGLGPIASATSAFVTSHVQAPPSRKAEVQRVLAEGGASPFFQKVFAFAESVASFLSPTPVISIVDLHANRKGIVESGIYDHHDQISVPRFNAVFEKYATHNGLMTASDTKAMINDLSTTARGTHGPIRVWWNKFKMSQQYNLLVKVAADKQAVDTNGNKVPAMSRERLLAFYDGTLFWKIADDVAAKASDSKKVG